jgi:hypothetical protein
MINTLHKITRGLVMYCDTVLSNWSDCDKYSLTPTKKFAGGLPKKSERRLPTPLR